MRFRLDDDQESLRDHMGAFFESTSTWEVVRSAEPAGFDAQLWDAVVEVGLPGMAVSPHHGGGGSTLLDAAIVVEQAGRHAAPVPLVEHIVAARMASDCRALKDDVVAEVVAGRRRATVALRPSVAGTWRIVPAGAIAHIVFGEDDSGSAIVAQSEPSMRPLANIAAAPLADRSSLGGRVDIDLAAALDEWRTLTASLLVGVASRALDMGVVYAKDRHQFGRRIGAFQAVQHALADLVGPLDGARLLAAKAAWACDHDDERDRAMVASMAFVHAADVARRATAAVLHLHGGYGVMREYDIQLLFRRARGWSLVLDDPEREVQRLADVLFGTNAG